MDSRPTVRFTTQRHSSGYWCGTVYLMGPLLHVEVNFFPKIRIVRQTTSVKIFRENLLCHISDYCHPLKPLVNTFYSVLADAYEYHTSDDLHEKVIDAFDKAEILVNELPEEHTRKYRDEQETEEARRAQDLPGRWDWKSPSSKGKDGTEPDDPSPHKSLPPDPGSPTPAGKRPKLTSGKGDQRERR